MASTAMIAQDYIDIITTGVRSGTQAAGQPAPEQKPLSFDERLTLATLHRKVADAASEVLTPVSDSGNLFCNHCTHRLTERFHLTASLPGVLTNNIHFTKRHRKLVDAIDALPEGNEKSLAQAFEKAAVYAYALQEARLSTKTKSASLLVEVGAKAVGATDSRTENLKIDCAGKAGDFASSGILYARLRELQTDLHARLMQKVEELKNPTLVRETPRAEEAAQAEASEPVAKVTPRKFSL